MWQLYGIYNTSEGYSINSFKGWLLSLGRNTSHKVEKTLLNLTSFFIEICNRFYSNDDLIKSQPRIAITSDYNRIRRNRESLNIYISQ